MPTQVTKPLDSRGHMRIERLPIATGQTYKAGDFLAVNSSGQLIQAVASGNGASTNGQFTFWASGIVGLIAGRANEDAQPQSGDVTILPNPKLYGSFIVAEPGTQFLVPVFNGTAASAYPTLTSMFTGLELWNLSLPSVLATGVSWPSNAYCIRPDKTTNTVAQIVDWDPTTYPGFPDVGQVAPPTTGTLSQYPYAWIEFLGGQTLLSGARPLTRSN